MRNEVAADFMGTLCLDVSVCTVLLEDVDEPDERPDLREADDFAVRAIADSAFYGEAANSVDGGCYGLERGRWCFACPSVHGRRAAVATVRECGGGEGGWEGRRRESDRGIMTCAEQLGWVLEPETDQIGAKERRPLDLE